MFVRVVALESNLLKKHSIRYQFQPQIRHGSELAHHWGFKFTGKIISAVGLLDYQEYITFTFLHLSRSLGVYRKLLLFSTASRLRKSIKPILLYNFYLSFYILHNKNRKYLDVHWRLKCEYEHAILSIYINAYAYYLRPFKLSKSMLKSVYKTVYKRFFIKKKVALATLY